MSGLVLYVSTHPPQPPTAAGRSSLHAVNKPMPSACCLPGLQIIRRRGLVRRGGVGGVAWCWGVVRKDPPLSLAPPIPFCLGEQSAGASAWPPALEPANCGLQTVFQKEPLHPEAACVSYSVLRQPPRWSSSAGPQPMS